MKYKSRIKKSRIIDLNAGLLIGYSRVYLFYYVFGGFFSLSIYKVKDGPVSLDIRVYTEFGGPKSSVQSTLIRQCYNTINN